MHSKIWLIFVCVQTAGVVAMHLGRDWCLVLGVVLLLPGTGLYVFTGIHRLILIGDVRLALMVVLLNAVVWHCVAVSIRRLKHRIPVSK